MHNHPQPTCPVHGSILIFRELVGENPDGSWRSEDYWYCPTNDCDYDIEAWEVTREVR